MTIKLFGEKIASRILDSRTAESINENINETSYYIDQLKLKNPNKIHKILITTVGRSGSSVFGQLLSQMSAKSWYVFEPFHQYSKKTNRLVSFQFKHYFNSAA